MIHISQLIEECHPGNQFYVKWLIYFVKCTTFRSRYVEFIRNMPSTPYKIVAAITSIVMLSVLFSFLGVFDTNTMPFLRRIFFWGATIGSGSIVTLLSMHRVNALLNQSIFFQLVALSSLASIPVVFVLAAFDGGLTGSWPLSNWGYQYLLALSIALFINTGAYISLKAVGWIPSDKPLAINAQSPELQFLERLPAKYNGAELYAASSEDHYVRVHTSRGEELILMRFADALKELNAVDGVQTHRSWWVARNGVLESIRQDGKYGLVLKSGAIASISRSFSKAVREKNYI